jgi:hypothetical protein
MGNPTDGMIQYQGRTIRDPRLAAAAAEILNPGAPRASADVWAQDEASRASAPVISTAVPVNPAAPSSNNPLLSRSNTDTPISGLPLVSMELPAKRAPLVVMNPDGTTTGGAVSIPRMGHSGTVLPADARQYWNGPITAPPAPAQPPPAVLGVTPRGNDYENAFLSLLKEPPRAPSYSAKVPAAWQEAGGTRVAYSPEVLRGMDDINAQKAKDAQDQLDKAKLAGEEQAAFVEGLRDESNIKELQRRQMQAAQDKEKLQAVDDIRATADAISKQKIDPEAIWKEKGDGAKFLAGIGIALGAFGAARNGGQNAALSIVQDSINKNIDAQQSNIANQREGLKAKTGLYGMMLDRFKDRDMALGASKAALYEQAELKAKEWAARNGIDQSSAQYQGLMQGLAEQKIEQMNKINGVIESRYAPARSVSGGGGPKPLSVEQKMSILKGAHEMGKEGKADGPKAETWVPAAGGYARDAVTAHKLNTMTESAKQIESNTRRILELKTGSTYTGPLSDARAESSVLESQNASLWKEVMNLGVMSDSDRKLVAPLTGEGALDWTSVGGEKKLRTALEVVRKMPETAYKVHGVTPGAEHTPGKGQYTGTASTVSPVGARSVIKKPGDK